MTLLTPADVLKIKCRFVTEMIKFVKRKKYIMAPCLCEVYPYYADYLLSTLAADCLEYDDECTLKKISDSSSDQDPIDPTIIPCSTQIDPLLSYSSSSTCTYSATVENQYDGSAYPTIVLTDNSEFVNITADVVLNNTCNHTIQTETIIGGCIDGDCQDGYLGRVIISSGMTSFIHGANAVAPEAYITKLRIYTVDDTGLLDPTPIDLDLNINTSPYYAPGVDCPGCTALILSDVQFGNVDLQTNFATLMDNVGLALFGDANTHKLDASYSIISGRVGVNNVVVHNPAGPFFGTHKPDLFMEVYNVNTDTYATSTLTTSLSSGGMRLRNSLSFDVPCGTVDPIIKTTTTSVGMDVDWANTSFNEIKLLSLYANKPLYGVSGTTTDCIVRQLQAIYTPTSEITNVEWLNPLLEVISTMDTAVAVDAGTYTFKIYLSTGCVVIKTIDVPAV